MHDMFGFLFWLPSLSILYDALWHKRRLSRLKSFSTENTTVPTLQTSQDLVGLLDRCTPGSKASCQLLPLSILKSHTNWYKLMVQQLDTVSTLTCIFLTKKYQDEKWLNNSEKKPKNPKISRGFGQNTRSEATRADRQDLGLGGPRTLNGPQRQGGPDLFVPYETHQNRIFETSDFIWNIRLVSCKSRNM